MLAGSGAAARRPPPPDPRRRGSRLKTTIRRAPRRHLADVAEVDAADREPGPLARHLGGVARTRSPAAGRPSFVGVSHTGRRSAGPPPGGRRLELRRAVGGEPDQHLVADLLAHLVDRNVVLTDVHAVGSRLESQVGAVVQPEQRVVLVERAEARGRLQYSSSEAPLARSWTMSAPPRRAARTMSSGTASTTK